MNINNTVLDGTMFLDGYFNETYLPCELDEVISHVRKKTISAKTENKVGLTEYIKAIPLNRGYILYTKKLVLFTSSLEPFFYLDGTHTLSDLSAIPEMKLYLQQLHYYNLLSLGPNNGQIKAISIDQKYMKLYQEGEFFAFSLIPLTVELDITNSCNSACIHCHRDSKPINIKGTSSSEELSTEELLAIIGDCARIGVPEFILMGGEPLIHPDFFRLVEYAKEKGVRNVRTSTNGQRINEGTAKELAKYFDDIQISIHGASASTHDYIVKKKGAWEQAKRAIKLLKENNLKVNVSFTVMRENVNDIKKMPYLVNEWGADSLRFLRLSNMGRGSLLKGWNEEEITQIGKQIHEIHENLSDSRFEMKVGGFPPVDQIRNDATFYGCAAGRTLLHIAYDGYVNACGSIEGNYIGNIRENNILDLWHSLKLIEMRKQLKCNCNYRSICSGPCKVD